jgi:hypothetical protein
MFRNPLSPPPLFPTPLSLILKRLELKTDYACAMEGRTFLSLSRHLSLRILSQRRVQTKFVFNTLIELKLQVQVVNSSAKLEFFLSCLVVSVIYLVIPIII